jgi:hypothetical protein
VLWYTAEAIITALNAVYTQLRDLLQSNHKTVSVTLVVVQDSLNRLEKKLAKLLLPIPGQFGKLTLIAEDSANMLIYTIPLPPVPSPKVDVVSGRFSKNGEVIQTVDIASLDSGTVVVSDEFSAVDGEIVNLEYTHIDDAGNVSEPMTFAFVATDTIPPNAPAPFGALNLVREE